MSYYLISCFRQLICSGSRPRPAVKVCEKWDCAPIPYARIDTSDARHVVKISQISVIISTPHLHFDNSITGLVYSSRVEWYTAVSVQCLLVEQLAYIRYCV